MGSLALKDTTQTASQVADDQATKKAIKTFAEMGTFGPVEPKTPPKNGGPMFTPANDPSFNLSKIITSDIKTPRAANIKALEGFDIRRLGSILAEEAIKLGNLDLSRVTEEDRNKILTALYILNPKKYPFVKAVDEKLLPKEIVPAGEKKQVDTSTDFSLRRLTAELVDEKGEGAAPPNKPKVLRTSGVAKKPTNQIPSTQRTPSPVVQEPPKKLVPPPIELAEIRKAISDNKPLTKVEVPQVAMKEVAQEYVTKEEPVQTPAQEQGAKMQAISNIYSIFTKQRITAEDWASPIKGAIKVSANDEPLNPNLSVRNKEAWREVLPLELKLFLADLMSSSEETLITKYVPTYANSLNPSSWQAVSDFDAYEILHNENPTVFGLTEDRRGEISKLIDNMKRITEITQSQIRIVKGLTVHILYEQTRSAVAMRDKKEY